MTTALLSAFLPTCSALGIVALVWIYIDKLIAAVIAVAAMVAILSSFAHADELKNPWHVLALADTSGQVRAVVPTDAPPAVALDPRVPLCPAVPVPPDFWTTTPGKVLAGAMAFGAGLVSIAGSVASVAATWPR